MYFFSCMPLQFAYKIINFTVTLSCVNIIVFYSRLPYSYPSNAPFPHQSSSSSKRVPLGFHVTFVFGELCLNRDSTGEKKIKIWSYDPLLFHPSLFVQTPSVPSESSVSFHILNTHFLLKSRFCLQGKKKKRMIFVLIITIKNKCP